MPITFADVNTDYKIKRIKGDSKAVKHLEDLGFHVGGTVMVVNKSGNDLIVKVKVFKPLSFGSWKPTVATDTGLVAKDMLQTMRFITSQMLHLTNNWCILIRVRHI